MEEPLAIGQLDSPRNKPAPNQRRGPEQELLASELLIPMAKFSKYLTGCAALHTGAVETLPYWFEVPAVEEALASQL